MNRTTLILAAAVFCGAFLVTMWVAPHDRQIVGPNFHFFRSLRPDQIPAAVRQSARNRAIEAVGQYRLGIADDVVIAASDDAPRTAGQASFAERDQVLVYTDWDHDTGVPRDMKVGCFAIRSPDGQDTTHRIVKHDNTRIDRDDTVELWEWVISGCAQAVRSNPQALGPEQIDATLLKLTPGMDAPALRRPPSETRPGRSKSASQQSALQMHSALEPHA